MRNSLLKMAALLFCVSAVMADVSSLSKGYLPPDQGYNYDAPSVPFNNGNRPQPTVTPRPPNYSTPPSYPTQPPYRPIYSTPKPPAYGGGSGYAEEGSQISPVSNPGAGLGGGEFDHLQQPHVPGMPYDFNYAVKDDYFGTDYGHQATSNGDQVRGEYRVQLPDGRLQIVKYLADWKDGYTAEVTYEGEAKYPTAPSGSGSGIGAPSGYPSPIGKPQPSPGYPQPSPGYPKPSPGYPQPSPGYPQPSPGYPSYPQPSPAYPSPSPSYPSPSPSYPIQTIPSYQPPKPINSYPKPGSSGSSFGGSQQVPVSTGYPSGIPSGGYPSGLPSGYPSGVPSSGYPSSSPTSGYPAPSKPSSGYGQPSNFAPQGSYGAPSQGPISGYGGSQQPTSGYSSPAPSYSSGSDYGGY